MNVTCYYSLYQDKCEPLDICYVGVYLLNKEGFPQIVLVIGIKSRKFHSQTYSIYKPQQHFYLFQRRGECSIV